MTADNSPYILFYILAAVLVGSSLMARQIPMGKALKMALAWVGIFAVAFVLFAFRSEFSTFGQRLRAEALGTPIQAGETLRVPVADDGHFYVDVMINGHEVRLMVDSGASVTTVSRNVAEEADMDITARRSLVSTANGPASVSKAYAGSLELGSIVRTDFPVDVSDQDDVNLLGMNFLSSLSSWRVEGNYLVLQP